MTNTFKHARLAALTIGACLSVAACGGDRAADDAAVTDTAAGAVATTPAVGGAGTGSMEATNEPRSDSDILTMISHSNSAEVSSSNLALQNASNAQVKAFARQMVNEHTAMQKQGQQLGKSLAMEGTGSDTAQSKMEHTMDNLDDLKDKKGADFDRAYMDMQVRAHEQTLTELRSYEGRAQSAELKQHITQAIPKVEAHLQKAQQLRQQLGS
jgi:putative membrane protein